MRVIKIFIFCIVAYIAPANASTPDEYCKIYSGFNYAEASKEYRIQVSLSHDLDSKVGEHLSKGTPESDPEFSEMARNLGDAIGKSYALCVCNKELSKSNNCQAFVEHMSKRKTEH